MWIEILKRQVAEKGPKVVARELGISRSAVDLVTQGKYNASTKRIIERVKRIYGVDGKIECPVKGALTPIECSENYRKAKLIGMRCGNPETLRLYKCCMSCSTRKV